MPFESGEVITYITMCQEEGTNLQRGMNFQLGADHSVVLMSQRPGAPYVDRVEERGTVIIYQGHNQTRSRAVPSPHRVDQRLETRTGRTTQNGRFFEAAGSDPPELVRVYEKILTGMWVYNGAFYLTDAWDEFSDGRRVFKFRLEAVEGSPTTVERPRERSRVIPSAVKRAVWQRDGGKCVLCGADENLHYDHDLPYSRGGSSTIENVRILCARHNLEKGARIE